MTAADRPSVTDSARAEAERRYPTAHPDDVADVIRRAAFVAGAEWAADRAETTTATVEGITEALYEATQDPNDIEVPAVARRLHGLLSARGLLATARTRPTREQIAKTIHSVTCGLANCGMEYGAADEVAANKVLALLADQPTEGTRWWVPAYRTPEPNSRVQRLGSPTVLREYAEREVEQYRKQEAEDPKGNPDAIFLATRIQHPWTEADQ